MGLRSSVLLLLLGIGGCVADDAPEVTSSTVPELEGRVTLEIGALDGPPPMVFGRISGLVGDAASNVIVADAQAEEVDVARRLDARGRIVRAGHTDGRRRG